MVRPERFELPTCCSGGNRSIQLSYGRTPIRTVYMGRVSSFNPGVESNRREFKRCFGPKKRSGTDLHYR